MNIYIDVHIYMNIIWLNDAPNTIVPTEEGIHGGEWGL